MSMFKNKPTAKGINETVLEMHFHRPLLDLFRTTLGLGPGAFKFL